jgi:hypothetical protein
MFDAACLVRVSWAAPLVADLGCEAARSTDRTACERQNLSAGIWARRRVPAAQQYELRQRTPMPPMRQPERADWTSAGRCARRRAAPTLPLAGSPRSHRTPVTTCARRRTRTGRTARAAVRAAPIRRRPDRQVGRRRGQTMAPKHTGRSDRHFEARLRGRVKPCNGLTAHAQPGPVPDAAVSITTRGNFYVPWTLADPSAA